MKHPELFKYGKQFIKSMQELTERYQKAMELGISKCDYEMDRDMDCLLCNPIGVKKNQFEIYRSLPHADDQHKSACSKLGCPWIVILGMTCDEFSLENEDLVEMIYQTDDPVAMQARVDQLQEWIGIYREFMKTRKK